MSYFKQKGIDFFKQADIIINGSRPGDIQVNNDKFFSRLLTDGTIALGESYMDGWWEVEDMVEFISKALNADLEKKLRIPVVQQFRSVKKFFTNIQSKIKASKDVRFHYDLGTELFEKMLDKNMNYSGAFWKDARTLDEAQIAKMDLICKKLYLKPGMKVLDIGCGFGGLAKYMAKNYKVKVTGITLSKDQYKYAKQNCKDFDIKITIEDYRDHIGKYDRIVSVGMVEHTGYKNHKQYLESANKNLKPKGLFLLQTIGSSNPFLVADPWITKYVFPGTELPSVKQITNMSEDIFIIEDLHNIGIDYHKTLQAWFKNFDKNWEELKDKYDEKFYRMWKYYLLACSAGFKTRNTHLFQFVFSKRDIDKGYDRVCLNKKK